MFSDFIFLPFIYELAAPVKIFSYNIILSHLFLWQGPLLRLMLCHVPCLIYLLQGLCIRPILCQMYLRLVQLLVGGLMCALSRAWAAIFFCYANCEHYLSLMYIWRTTFHWWCQRSHVAWSAFVGRVPGCVVLGLGACCKLCRVFGFALWLRVDFVNLAFCEVVSAMLLSIYSSH